MIGLLALNILDLPLFAIDLDVVFGAIVVIVAIVSWISQYITKQKAEVARQRRLEEQAKHRLAMEQQEQEGGRPQAQEPQRQFGRLPEQRPQPAAAPVDDNVASEIRDFLERAATGRPVGQAPGRPRPIPPVVAAPVIPVAEEVHRPLAEQSARRTSIEQRPTPTSHQTARPVEAKVVSERKLTARDRRQAEATQSKKQAETKQRQVTAARSKSSSLQKSSKFDRKLGSLKQQARSQKSESSEAMLLDTMATDIAAMFADTNSIRQAIIINEVLTRPTHRWE